MTPLPRMTAATADVLRVLVDDAAEPDGVWGMRIIKRTGRPAGTVYPILERLEGAGWVTSAWEADSARSGPRRRHYALSPDGAEAALAALRGVAAARPRVRAALRGAGA